MTTNRVTLADRIDSDAVSGIATFGSLIILFIIGLIVVLAFNAASEDRTKEISIACINSGGVWTEGANGDPATCTRP